MSQQVFTDALREVEGLLKAVPDTEQLHEDLERHSQALHTLHDELAKEQEAQHEQAELAHSR